MPASVFGAADRAYALLPTSIQTADVAAAGNQLVPCNTTLAGLTVTLPATPADLTVVAVKLLAGANVVTIATSAGDAFDAPVGSTTQTLTIPGEGAVFQYSAAAAVWYVTSDPLPLADLDARYVLQSAGAMGWFNVKAAAYGATGDGSTDDSLAILAAVAAAGQFAGRGLVYLPAGRYLVTPATATLLFNNGTAGYQGVHLLGDGAEATFIMKGGNGVLMNLSGPATDPTGATHTKYCSIKSMTINGGTYSGMVWQAYYADNWIFRDVHVVSNRDVVLGGVEFWDSRVEDCAIEYCGSLTADAATPNFLLQNSAAASGFGFSTDNINQIHFRNTRFEGFHTGAIWLQQGTGNTNTANGVYISDCKMESGALNGGPHLLVDSTAKHVKVDGLYCYSGGWSAGYSTANDVISWSPRKSELCNVFIASGSSATVKNGVTVNSATSGEFANLENVTALYGSGQATGAHINFGTATGGFKLSGDFTSNATTQWGGTIPVGDGPTVGSAMQIFTSSGTWQRPPGAVLVDVTLIGGGGGGGSGAVEASGTVSGGGAGGGGGAFTMRQFPASVLNATEAVQVGTGGAGGTAVGTTAANGNAGSAGSSSLFRANTFLAAAAGQGGAGGTTTGATGGTQGNGSFNGGAGAASSSTGLVGSGGTGVQVAGAGGGSGGGITTAAAASAGGAGGQVSSSIGNAGGTAGTSAGGAGGAGVSVPAGTPLTGTGGGGGGSSTTGNGGAGGAAGSYGAGGGGGGAALTGHSSGAGGAGAPGIVIVVTTCSS